MTKLTETLLGQTTAPAGRYEARGRSVYDKLHNYQIGPFQADEAAAQELAARLNGANPEGVNGYPPGFQRTSTLASSPGRGEPLSDQDKQAILEDFREWSGGFDPNEMTPEELDVYLSHSLSTQYNQDVVGDWLHDYGVEPAQALSEALLEQQFKFKQGKIDHPGHTQAELDQMGAEVLVSNMKQLEKWLQKFPDIKAKLEIVRHNPKDIGFDGKFDGEPERFDFPFNTGAFFEKQGLLPHQQRQSRKESNGAFDIPSHVEVRDGVPSEIRRAMEKR